MTTANAGLWYSESIIAGSIQSYGRKESYKGFRAVIASQQVGAGAPPDDRLREAIHRTDMAVTGLLRSLRSSQ
jgi:hypothetical protein